MSSWGPIAKHVISDTLSVVMNCVVKRLRCIR